MKMSIMNLSRFDFMDRLSAFTSMHTSKHKLGHEITYKAIAIDDVIQTLDEFMGEDDYFKVISEGEYEVNDYVWYNKRIYRISDINGIKIEIYDLETKSVKKVKESDISICFE